MASSLSRRPVSSIGANTLKYAIGFVPADGARALPLEKGLRHLPAAQPDFEHGRRAADARPADLDLLFLRAQGRRAARPADPHRADAGDAILTGVFSALMIGIGAPLLGKWMSNEALANLLPIYAFYVGVLLSGEHFMHVMISQNRYGMAVAPFEAGETAVQASRCLLVPISWGLGLMALRTGC